MESLPDSLLLQILTRLDDSADIARCRVASKAFNSVYPGLRSIHLRCSPKWRTSKCGEVINDLIRKLESVESVCIGYEEDVNTANVYLAHGGFVNKWLLPRVFKSLKSLSISAHRSHSRRKSNVLPLVSKCCHNLVNLKLKFAWLSMDNLNPMPMLTSLTLESARLEDENLNALNTCFPNLQVLNLVDVTGLKDPKIHLLDLKACLLELYRDYPSSLTLISPNLITLEIVCYVSIAVRIEAPMLTRFYLTLDVFEHADTFTNIKFENLKTLWLDSLDFGFLLSEFPITKTVEHLLLDCSEYEALTHSGDSKLSLAKAFMVFPNVSSLCINSGAWLELEAYRIGWEILDAGKALKTLCAYLVLVNPLLTFSYLACVLDQCGGLSEVSLLIHSDFVGTVSESFMSRCMVRWPGLKWRWGIWSEDNEDSWITDGISN